MKAFIGWIVAAVLLMVGGPWFTVTFMGRDAMALCFVLFFVANPLFCAVSGVFAGMSIRQLWSLPVINAVLFLAGSWIFFEIGEVAFLQYGGFYLIIGAVAMLLSIFIKNKKTKKKDV